MDWSMPIYTRNLVSIQDKIDIGAAYSNFSAATDPGNPDTRPTISHGLKVLRDVRAAPPLACPLCCFSRRGG